MFELRARTKNIDMRRSIESVTCTMLRTLQPASGHTTTLHDPAYHMSPPYEMTNTYPIIAYDAHGNELTDQHHQQLRLPPQRHGHAVGGDSAALSSSAANTDTYTATLMHIGMENLPCPRVQAADPTDLPLPRESIGLDLSWMSATGGGGGGANAVPPPAMATLLPVIGAAALVSLAHRWRLAAGAS